ncbi:uncharacterized protein N7482_010704 [Penicillium canariense]|uniref:Uncharacterized protein n=1 Tax=Penicillium canariense TaxID=189055 RepID=A0A9W9HNC4_9EURO|nr:uncharacterized protein N7482_010704 [Penicillium canariense]KAJ5151452.1 hypothetical protein N7482_010704 [Penicillium canariense]
MVQKAPAPTKHFQKISGLPTLPGPTGRIQVDRVAKDQINFASEVDVLKHQKHKRGGNSGAPSGSTIRKHIESQHAGSPSYRGLYVVTANASKSWL